MTQQEVMKAFMHSLDETELSARAALDEAIRASSDFENYQAVVNKFTEDAEDADNWDTFLQKYCGIILDNADTGAVSGLDAGGTEKVSDGVLPAEGDAQYPEGTSFTVKGVTIYGIPPKDTLTEAQQLVVRGLYSWWIRDSLELIEESYGMSYSEAGTTNSRLRLKFIDDESNSAMAYVSFDSPDNDLKVWESRVLCINMAYFNDITADNRHGYSAKLKDYVDRTLAHELTHGVMSSNVNYFYDLPNFLIEGGTAELIHGVDDFRRSKIIAYAKDPEKITKLLSMTYVEGNSPYEVYAGGYIFMRYFLKQAATDTVFDYDTYRAKINLGSGGKFANNYFDEVTITGGTGADTISNSGSEVVISGGKGADVLKNYGDEVTIRGGNGDDLILNGTGEDAEAAVVYGDAGNDTLGNFGVDSTLHGGTGNDFIYNSTYGEDSYLFGDAGDDQMQNYGEGATLDGGKGDDTIQIYASDSFVLGDKGADSIINYAEYAEIDGGADNDTIKNTSYTPNSTETTVLEETVGGATVSVETVNVETIYGDYATIYGGAGNDNIYNDRNEVLIFGDSGNDTVENYGVATISGGDGDDVFYTFSGKSDTVEVYGDGGQDYFFNDADKAIISGGADNDSVSNFGDESAIYGDAGNDNIYSAGNNCTVQGGAGKDTIINEGTQVYIDLDAGNDSLLNDGDRATIYGGAGNDTVTNSGNHIVYQFDGGRDIIFGANDGDTLELDTENYSTRVNGSDFVVSISGGTITFKDAADFTFNIQAENTSDTITSTAGLSYNSKKSLLTADKNFTGENISLAQNVQKVTASNVTGGVNLVGNALNNSIRGGKGNDTLFGGTGNDTMTGGNGADLFVYDSGNDIITDYRAGVDKIKIDSEITGAKITGSNVIFETDGGTLTVNNAKNKNLTVINNGNETTAKYSPWFVENNFAAADIDSITEEKFAVTSFETSTENLAQDDKILAYAE